MVFIFFTGAKEPSSWFAAQELGLGGTVGTRWWLVKREVDTSGGFAQVELVEGHQKAKWKKRFHIATSRIYLWHPMTLSEVRDHSKLRAFVWWACLKSRFGFRGVPTWPLLFYLHTLKAWQAQQLAEENKELFKTAGRHRMCTPDAANSYPKPFNSPLHTLSYPLDCTINRSIFALFGWIVEILWNL